MSLVNKVTIPRAVNIHAEEFEEATQELMVCCSILPENPHNIEIERAGGRIILKVDNQQENVDEDVRECCLKILRIANRFIPRDHGREEPRPLAGRVSPAPDPHPASSTDTSSPASTGPSSERTSSPSSSESDKEQNQQLQRELDAARVKNEELEKLVQDANNSHTSALFQIQRLRQEQGAISEAVEEQDLDKNARLQLIADQKKQIASLENELESLRSKLAQAREQNQSIWDGAEARDKQQTGEIAVLRSQLKEMGSELGGADAALEAYDAENAALKADAAKEKELSAAIVQQARVELDAMQKELNVAKEAAIEALNRNGQLAAKDGSLEEQRKTIERLIRERDEALARLKGVQETCDAMQGEVEKIKAREANQDQDFQKLYEALHKKTVSALGEKERENEALRQQLSQTHARASGKELTDANQRIKKLAESLEQSKAEIAPLKNELAKTQEKLTKAEADHAELSKQREMEMDKYNAAILNFTSDELWNKKNNTIREQAERIATLEAELADARQAQEESDDDEEPAKS